MIAKLCIQFLSVIILLLIITTICYYYAKRRSKQKDIDSLTIQKWIIMNLKSVCIKNRTCYYFDDLIKLEDFIFDNILIDEKSHENILIYDILYESLIGPKPLYIRFD